VSKKLARKLYHTLSLSPKLRVIESLLTKALVSQQRIPRAFLFLGNQRTEQKAFIKTLTTSQTPSAPPPQNNTRPCLINPFLSHFSTTLISIQKAQHNATQQNITQHNTTQHTHKHQKCAPTHPSSTPNATTQNPRSPLPPAPGNAQTRAENASWKSDTTLRLSRTPGALFVRRCRRTGCR